MNVLVVTTSYPRDSDDYAGHFVEAGCLALTKRGHSITVLAPHAPGLPCEQQNGNIQVRRFRYGLSESWEKVAYGEGIPQNLRSSLVSQLALPSFLLAMRRAVLREATRHDIVHAHWAISGVMAAYGADSARKPLIVSLRGSDAVSSGIRGWIAGRACRKASSIVGVSTGICRIAEKITQDTRKIRHIANGVDLPEICEPRAEVREELGMNPDGVYLIYLGRLSREKDPFLLLSAFRAMLESIDDGKQPYLQFVGNGPLEALLKKNAEDLGEKVKFAGTVSRRDAARYLYASDIFCLPSKSEGRSNALAEAVATGLPAVCTDVGGTEELVIDKKSGFIIPFATPEIFADALSLLVNNPAYRQSFGEAARKHAGEVDLSWGQHAELLEQLYEKDLSSALQS